MRSETGLFRWNSILTRALPAIPTRSDKHSECDRSNRQTEDDALCQSHQSQQGHHAVLHCQHVGYAYRTGVASTNSLPSYFTSHSQTLNCLSFPTCVLAVTQATCTSIRQSTGSNYMYSTTCIWQSDSASNSKGANHQFRKLYFPTSKGTKEHFPTPTSAPRLPNLHNAERHASKCKIV